MNSYIQMRVNLISNHRGGIELSRDIDITNGLLRAIFDDKVEIQFVQFAQPQCGEADINIFIEALNPCLFSYAAKNIWIPNPGNTPKTWEPYFHMVNEIWVRTREAERIFKDLTPTKVRYIGWSSLNKETPSKKNYFKAIVPLTANREIEPIFNAYLSIQSRYPTTFSKLPFLHIFNPHQLTITIPTKLENYVSIHNDVKEYDELLKECGLCICLSKTEAFGHSVNEALASGCNVIVSRIGAFLEDIVGEVNIGAQFCNESVILENTSCFGYLVSSDEQSLSGLLEDYTELSFKDRKARSEFMRLVYETNHGKWLDRMKEVIPHVLSVETPYSMKDGMPKEEDLPDVSIVCVTRDRRLFMPILKYSYMIQSYPEDKLELIIVDDGDDPIEDTLFGVPNVTYVRLEEKKTIGEKRNIGIAKAMYDVIAFMDDDDVYPNNSVLERVAMMMKSPAKECAFCTVIPCYDITKYCSFMNAPPIKLPMSQRVSEATLVFTKKFWEERPFGDTQIAEGDAFIRGREQVCRELSPQEVIVSLAHPKNTSSRKMPEFKEPNGCHFGFNEKLFAMVSEIGETLKAQSS